MKFRSLSLFAFGLLVAGWTMHAATNSVHACPFCTSVAQTFTEEMKSMQVVAIGSLIEAPPIPDSSQIDPTAPLPKAKFRITQVLKGEEWVKPESTIEVLYFGDANRDRPYLLMGTDAPTVAWSSPLGISERVLEYILQLPKLPADGNRLEFFQDYLEDKDEMLTRDAYDEFAKAPYKDVIALGPKMHHDRLVTWIKDPEVPASRRRLYYTMLGVCGKPEDINLLETLMVSEDRKAKAGLDALIACYLILKGPSGLELVEERFLKNPEAEYADTYAAIMAIRFHGTETNVIPKPRLIQALRHLLGRPELADLVIPDLARWEDWEVMPRLVELFKTADDKSSWVRVPVVNYLRACPLPEAQRAIEELSKIDPDAVKRAQTFFPVDQQPAGTAPSPAGGEQPAPDGNPPAIEQPKPDRSSMLVPPMPPAVFLKKSEPAIGQTTNSRTHDTANALSEAKSDQTAAEPFSSSAADRTSPAKRSPEPRSLARRPTSGDTTPRATTGQRWMNHRGVWGVPVLAGVMLWGTFCGLLGVRWRDLHD